MKKIFPVFCIAVALLCVFSCAATIKHQERYDGLRINVIGDSYVANHKQPVEESWHSKVASKYHMIYRNYGRNGCCVAYDRSKDGFGPSILESYQKMSPDADILLIIAGHNDARFIGNSTDSLHFFSNQLDRLLCEFEATYPNAVIGYVTPWYVDMPGFGPTIKAIKRICHKHHIPVLNNYSKNSIIKIRDASFRQTYCQGPDDMAHLNDMGHDLYLSVGEPFVLKLAKKAHRDKK